MVICGGNNQAGGVSSEGVESQEFSQGCVGSVGGEFVGNQVARIAGYEQRVAAKRDGQAGGGE
jgi:hypothetical protein